MGNNISGRNIPLLPTSTHFPSPSWYEKISIEGSVYGLYAGLNLILSIPSYENIENSKCVTTSNTDLPKHL